MTQEKLAQAQAALDRLESRYRLLKSICQSNVVTIGQSNVVAVGPSLNVTAESAEIVTRHAVITHSMNGGMIIGLDSSFFDNPEIRELCCLFKQKLSAIIEKEVKSLQCEFDNL